MQYKFLGRSGLQVSAVGLGCNQFGGKVDAEGTERIVRTAVDAGINFLDTADVYSRGSSEEFVGRAIAGIRDKVVLATKFGMNMGEGPYTSGASRRYILQEVEASLRRLGTDYIDLYQVHRPDPKTPIDETLQALDTLVRAGKVRYVGTSNFAPWQVVEASFVAQSAHLTSFVSEQPEYNLLDRRIEKELVPACHKYGVGIIPWAPLAAGFLSGKYHRGEPAPAGVRLSNPKHPWLPKIVTDRNYDLVDKIEAFARDRGHTVTEAAIAWLVAQEDVGTVIVGATRPDQVQENVQAAAWQMTPEERTELDAITRS